MDAEADAEEVDVGVEVALPDLKACCLVAPIGGIEEASEASPTHVLATNVHVLATNVLVAPPAQVQEEAMTLGGGFQSGEAWEAHVDCACSHLTSAAAGCNNAAVPLCGLVVVSCLPQPFPAPIDHQG